MNNNFYLQYFDLDNFGDYSENMVGFSDKFYRKINSGNKMI